MLYIIICSNMQIITVFYVSRVHFVSETFTKYVNFTWYCWKQIFCQIRSQGMYYSLKDIEVDDLVYVSCVT